MIIFKGSVHAFCKQSESTGQPAHVTKAFRFNDGHFGGENTCPLSKRRHCKVLSSIVHQQFIDMKCNVSTDANPLGTGVIFYGFFGSHNCNEKSITYLKILS